MSLSVGLVGFGLAGRTFHVPLMLHSGLNIVAVVTRQVQAVREVLPNAAVFEHLDDLLRLKTLDLVVIATPSHLHASQAIAALQSGRHVVVEKPVALTTTDVDRITEAAGEARRMVTVFQNRRWDSDFLTLRRLFAEGVLGEIGTFETRWDRFRPHVKDRWRERPEEGGGLLSDLGSHLIDQALNLFGAPEWVQGDVFSQRPDAIADDSFHIRMGKGRLRISLSARSLVADHRLRYQVDGSLGSLSKTGMDVQEDQLRSGLVPADPAFGIEPECQDAVLVPADSETVRRIRSDRGNWASFYAAVRESIHSGAVPPVLMSEVRQVVGIIEAARRSSETGCRIDLAEM
jgi:scyllo-inositol 2-dehydrogenase (NADP+)